MQYKVLREESGNFSASLKNLEKEVEELIKKGWIPQGGISISSFTIELPHYIIAQAMIKEE